MEEDGPCQRGQEDVRGSGIPNVMVVHVELIYKRGDDSLPDGEEVVVSRKNERRRPPQHELASDRGTAGIFAFSSE